MPTKKKHTVKRKPKHPEATDTSEAVGYLEGLHQEFQEQLHKYLALVHQQMQLQARVELAEKLVCVTRDHFVMATQSTEGTLPRDWSDTFAAARFVGVRLSDACVDLVRQHNRLSPENLLCYLNNGQYRFRTNAPLREIHGALLKQASVSKDGQDYVWAGEQRNLPNLKAVPVPALVATETEESKAS